MLSKTTAMSLAATELARAASSQGPAGMTPEAANILHTHKTVMITNEPCSFCKVQWGEGKCGSAVVFKLTTSQEGQAAIHGQVVSIHHDRRENGPDTFQCWCKILASGIQ